MAQGIKALRKLQMGAETTAGTAVAATSIWRGTGTIQDNRTTVFVPEDIGYLSGVDRTYVPKTEALLTLEETPATFEQLPYLFEMGVKSVTPTTDATGQGIFTYNFPEVTSDLPTASDLGTYTFEGGDNAECEEIEYGYCRSFTLSGTAGEALMMSAEIVGRQVSTSTFTGSLTLPSVEEVLFSKGKLYINDASASTDTQISNEFLDMNLTVNTGWMPVYTAEGNGVYYSFVKYTGAEILLDITFEYNTTAIAEITNWRDETARIIKVEFDGAAATSEFYFDLAGKWDNFQAIGERDGNDIVTGTFRARYNSTAAYFADFVIRNNLASLP